MASAFRIPLVPVTSSNLSAMGYDSGRAILAVRFRSGDIYHHGSVPAVVALELYTAPSRGAFYNSRIKGKFPGQKMTGECPKCGAKAGYIGERCTDCGCAEYAAAPRPVQHGISVDQPTGLGRFKRLTQCGRRVDQRDVAATLEGVTCPDCLRERATDDELGDQPF